MKRKIALSASSALVAGLALAVPAGLPAAAQDELPEWGEIGSARLVPVQETGPPSERLNLIVLCDGYTLEEMDQCAADVDRNQAVQWSVEPFRTYRHYINVYRLEIVSGESGIRCDPDEEGGPDPDKITPLRLVFSGGCVDPLARGVVYNSSFFGRGGGDDEGVSPSGSQQHDFYLENYVEPVLGISESAQNLQTLAIFNSFTYGGIGGTNATTSGGSPQGPLISLHELGHSLGNMQDEYPYSSRPTPGPPHGNFEPGSFHHTRMTSDEMIANEAKWWRWLGEESLAGGLIRGADPDGYESGLYRGSNVWRPSEHSIMRWIGFHFDQVGREHMVARITGQRFAGEMNLGHTPEGEVAPDSVLWVEPMQPKFHELDVTWRLGGPDGEVLDTENARSLDLDPLDLDLGAVVHVEVRDPVGPDGIDWVRNPSAGSSSTNSGYNGPRFVQTRQWTVGLAPTPPPLGDVDLVTSSSPTDRPVGGDEVVFVQVSHPAGHALEVTWELDGEPVDGTTDVSVDLGTLDLPQGTYELEATVTDPAPGGDTETVTWTVDNALPTAPRTLTEPLATLGGDVEHNVYFNEFDMLLDPQDDRTGYDENLFVVGELRLNEDGWFNYFGFPEEPFGTPFTFSHTGKDVKALTYGNLGTGGLSKATFEQTYTEEDANGPFVPGFGTHKVEHRAIDPAGNIGEPGEFRATVLPGELAECTDTITGSHNGRLRITSGVTCLDGASVNGRVTVSAGASLVATGSSISGGLSSTGADVVQLFDTTVNGATTIAGTTTDVTTAGNRFNGSVTLSDNSQEQANQQFLEFGYEYGPILAGNTINGELNCTGNSAPARDFEAPNTINGGRGGDCADL